MMGDLEHDRAGEIDQIQLRARTQWTQSKWQLVKSKVENEQNGTQCYRQQMDKNRGHPLDDIREVPLD